MVSSLLSSGPRDPSLMRKSFASLMTCPDPGAVERFPLASTEVSLLAVHPRLVELAQTVLAEQDLRMYAG